MGVGWCGELWAWVGMGAAGVSRPSAGPGRPSAREGRGLVATGSLAGVPGRYDFSLPEPPPRDGWFRAGTLDVTTTALMVGLAIASWFVYAISPTFLFKGAFVSDLVADGEVWRLVTYPIVNPPVGDLGFLWAVITLFFFWWVGHQVEENAGRVPFTVLVLVMTAVPAAVVTLLGTANEINARWSAFSYGLITLALAFLVVFALENPQARGFFNLPVWVFAAAYVLLTVLQLLGNRAWAQLILSLLIIGFGVVGCRQLGMLTDYEFIPAMGNYATGRTATYDRATGAGSRPRVKKQRGRRRGKATRGGSGETVVAGPWGEPSGPSRLEQAELDVLLDKISEAGIESLNPMERKRLNELSRKMRGS